MMEDGKIKLCDLHTHTFFSFDGKQTVDELCRAAIDKGLSAVAITEHCDIDGIADGLYPKYDADRAVKAVLEAKKRYEGRLEVLLGIELGQPHCMPKEAGELIASHPYDFVLGSLHNMRKTPDFSFLDYKAMEETITGYFFSRSLDELLEVLDFGPVNSLAHITYPVRYIRRRGCDISYDKYRDKFYRIFEKLILRDKALELNVSGLRGPEKCTLPDMELVEMYYDFGGRLITVGSDAHYSKDVGTDIDTAYEMLAGIGFENVYIFRAGKPVAVKIK